MATSDIERTYISGDGSAEVSNRGDLPDASQSEKVRITFA